MCVQIVANNRNGLDVDKYDYLQRDSMYSNTKISVDFKRIFPFVKVHLPCCGSRMLHCSTEVLQDLGVSLLYCHSSCAFLRLVLWQDCHDAASEGKLHICSSSARNEHMHWRAHHLLLQASKIDPCEDLLKSELLP